MKRIIPSILLLFFANTLLSQNLKIYGIVYDEEFNCLPFVNVRVVDSDTTTIAAMGTGYDGSYSFSLTADEQEQYFLAVSHIAYENQMIPIQSNDSVVDIYLQLSQLVLGNVEIVAKKPIFENKEGKIIVNVQQIANSTTMNTAKILSRLPGVTASDKEGGYIKRAAGNHLYQRDRTTYHRQDGRKSSGIDTSLIIGTD